MSWTHLYSIPPPAPGNEVRKDWTTAILSDRVFMFQSGHTHILELDMTVPGSPSITAFQPTFITDALNNGSIEGIFPARGRLGAWDVANAIYWSDIDDPTDFTPSVETGATVTKANAVRGRIVYVLGTADGFVIYSTSNVVRGSASFVTAQRIFDFSEISPDLGVFSSDHVVQGSDGEHWVWSQGALYRLNPGTIVGQHSVQIAHVEMADFVKEHIGYPKLSFHTNRYLVVSVAQRDLIFGESLVWRDRSPGNQYFLPAIHNIVDIPEVPPQSLLLPPGVITPPLPDPVCTPTEVPPGDNPAGVPYTEPLAPEQTWPEPQDDTHWTLWAMHMKRAYVPELEERTFPAGLHYEITGNLNRVFEWEDFAPVGNYITEADRTFMRSNSFSSVTFPTANAVNWTVDRKFPYPTLSWSVLPLMMTQFRHWIGEKSDNTRLFGEFDQSSSYTTLGWLRLMNSPPTLLSSEPYVGAYPRLQSTLNGNILTNVAERGFARRTIQAEIGDYYETIYLASNPSQPAIPNWTLVNTQINPLADSTPLSAAVEAIGTIGNSPFLNYYIDPGPADWANRSSVERMHTPWNRAGITYRFDGTTAYRLVAMTDNNTYATVGIFPHFSEWYTGTRTTTLEWMDVFDRQIEEVGETYNIYRRRLRSTTTLAATRNSGFTALTNAPFGYADITNTTPKLDENWAWRAMVFSKQLNSVDPRPYLRQFYNLAIARQPQDPIPELKRIYEANGWTVNTVNNTQAPLRDFEDPTDWSDVIRTNGEPDGNGLTEEGIIYNTACGEDLGDVVEIDPPADPIEIIIPGTPPAQIEFNLDEWRFQSPEIVSLQGNIGDGPYYPTYLRAFVYDKHLQRWGSCDVPHELFLNVAPINAVAHDPMTDQTTSSMTYENYLSKLGCILPNGLMVFFDRTAYKSFIVVGKLGMRRRLMSRFLEAGFEFAELPDCYVIFEPADVNNPKVVQPAGVRIARPTAAQAKMLIDCPAHHCNLVVLGGRYEIIQVEAGLWPAGDH